MKVKISIIVLLISKSLFLYAQEVDLNDTILKNKIDSYLIKSSENGYSASILVAKNKKIILSKGYGWADREHKIQNNSTTVFNLGSITKQFTAAGIMKLVEQNKVKTTDTLDKYFENVPDDKKSITIHQLLTHSSGISVRIGGFRYKEATKTQFLKDFYESKLHALPGSTYQYANANYIMLALLIEVVSKQDYTTFLKTNFWVPLQMNHTGYKSISFSSDKLAHGYYYNYTNGEWLDWGTTQKHLPITSNHWYSIGKGDIHSNTEDLFKWHLALENSKVLSKKSVELIETEHIPENESKTSHYGYGWAIFKTKNGDKIITHNGSNGVYFSNFIRFKKSGYVIIVLSNTILNTDSENVAWEIAKMIENKDYEFKPVTKSVYELVYDFIRNNTIDSVENLPDFLKSKNISFKNKAVLNRIGNKLTLKEKKPGWGLALLNLNVNLFPDDGNLWDSLGDAYFKYQIREKAINSYSKALELKSKENCYWCSNSKNKLKILGN